MSVMKPIREVGIVGYGAYVPRYRIPADEINRVWTEGQGGVPIKEKSVPGPEIRNNAEIRHPALGNAHDGQSVGHQFAVGILHGLQ